MVSELTKSRSNKGFVGVSPERYRATAGTEPNPAQFSERLLGVYRASLWQQGWGSSPFTQEELQGTVLWDPTTI